AGPPGKPSLKSLETLKHRVQRHVAAITPAPNADAGGVYPRLPFQPSDPVALVGEFLGAKPQVNGLFKQVPPASRSTVVQGKNHEPFLRHQLVPQKICSAPGIQHDLSMRPTVSVDEHWILLRRIELRRLDHPRIELDPVVRFDLGEFRSDQ